ncbi:hypothetical protein SGGMMB4_02331 [Sodalis glossinidius str. 'morsitans']|uniref:Uncharacterized protein n=1 Tax=Sodalis glossinidius (strain morsitans) TaxID=343509 RepID=A0A193QIC8_SODGM|nr:hypothetical protein [Sodalis glossinidius]CRL44921.1 hypothetical protein SGGMMB4_02331 [Sodalis glossinidius str. 'morsitans']
MFKTFWTLKIINVLFIISGVACLSLALASFSGTAAPYMQVTDGILALLTLLGVRLTLECIAVQFVQAETLKKILSKLENKDINHE